jgi:putative protease
MGACTHPCRWKYYVVEESRPGRYMPIEENDRGTFIFNSGDLCMIEHIPDLIHAGIDSFKIEGRMKTALYVAAVTRTYRKAIDDYLHDPKTYASNMDYYQSEIGKCTYRKFTTGFYYGRPDQDSMVYDSNTYVNEAVFLGIVEKITPENRARIMQRNKFCVGDRIEVMKPDGRDIPIIVKAMYNQNGEEVDSAPHPKEIIDLELVLEEDMSVSADVEEGDLLRVVMDPA